MRTFGFAFVILFGLATCATSAAQSDQATPMPSEETAAVDQEQPFELAMGGSVTVANSGTQLTFRAVNEDSRCPARVNCIWAGRVVIEVDAQSANEPPETFTLSTCCGATDHVYAGQLFLLQGVGPPPPPPGNPIPPADYRATLVVTSPT
jgi:hypothetical protein